LTGDYNDDGAVDAADYVVWRKTLGQDVFLAADGNGNGEIEDGDYTKWGQHFGDADAPSGGGAFSVPEPTGQLLVLAGLAGLIAISPRLCGSGLENLQSVGYRRFPSRQMRAWHWPPSQDDLGRSVCS
jgi:hypothetical protein